MSSCICVCWKLAKPPVEIHVFLTNHIRLYIFVEDHHKQFLPYDFEF